MTAIRPIAEPDVGLFVAFRLEALAASPLAFTSSPEDDFVGSPDAVRAMLARAPNEVIFGAFDGGLVGAVGLYRERHRKSAHRVHLWGMYVRPDHRRRGLGRALLEAAVRHARSLPGVTQVGLGVTSAAGAARSLYERAGFEIWGTETDALRDGGETAHQHYMTLRLD